ncbi:MAG: LPS export ABC transporter periplasmic protein LptC [Candidatus Aminicenantes bacterium]|nr:MAG: LPS export ABC transporter periplasmic protein LptC [Candidatus Aminicenantes bacterium]
MKKTKFSWAKGIRFSIAAFFLVILGLILENFITQSKRQPEVSVKSEEITQQKIENREKVEYLEVEREKGNLRLRADKQYIGEDDRYHLEGNVEVVFLKRREGKDIFLFGEEVTYDREGNHFFISGKARIKHKDLVIESISLSYDKEKELFRSDEGINFSSDRASGYAQKMTYSLKQEKIVLQEKIRLEMIQDQESSLPLVAEANRFEYSRKSSSGKLEGDVRLFHGKSEAYADILSFVLSSDEEQIKTLLLKGNARAILIDEETENQRREIEAEEILLKVFPDIAEIHEVIARKDCNYKLFSSSDGFTEVHSESMKFVLNRDGGLENFHAKKNTRMVTQEESSEEQQIVTGDEMLLEGKANILQVKGKDKFRVKVKSSLSEIFAKEVDVSLDDNILEAKGGIKVVLKAQDREDSVGFFSKARPVFITAKEMRFLEEEKRFFFMGNTKIWQENDVLRAGEIMLNAETRKILCIQGVKATVPYKPKDKEEERVEISSDVMIFKPDENLVSYRENASLGVKDIKLRARSISVYLKEEKGEMKKIFAHENIIVEQGSREGRGKEASYDIDEEIIVLSGNPVLIEKDKGMTRGNKLTFYISDGRIAVENKDRERSVTVIKS